MSNLEGGKITISVQDMSGLTWFLKRDFVGLTTRVSVSTVVVFKEIPRRAMFVVWAGIKCSAYSIWSSIWV